MTPREYLDIARQRWRSVVAALLLGLAAAAAAIYLVPREYAASVTVMVAPQPGPDPTASTDDAEISGQRLGIYSELLSSTRLTRDVVADLGLATTPEQLAGRIVVTTSPDSVLLTAIVTDSTSDGAVAIANAVADQFIQNVAEIEQPADPTRPPPVVGKVFDAAQPPADQIAPRPVMYVAVGALLGLLLGCAAALLRNGLDTTLRRRSQLEDILRAPVLGMIGRDPKIARSPLVVYGDPQAPLAEAFRQLRTNVQFTDIDRAHKLILVTSPSWGEGKTTTVCNLALALAEAGTSVLIIDADLRRASVAACLSMERRAGLTDVLVGRVPIEQAVQPLAPALDVLPSGPLPPNPSELLGSSRMIKLIGALRLMYEVVLIDAAPLLPVTDAAVLAPRVDGVLVLVRHGHTDGRDLQAAKDALDAVSGRILGSVMTMVPHAGKRVGRRRKPRKGIRQPRALGRTPGAGPGGEPGPAAPGAVTAPQAVPPQAVPPQGAAPQAAARKPGPAPRPPEPGPAPRPPEPGPAPRPLEPSESSGQVLDRGPAAR